MDIFYIDIEEFKQKYDKDFLSAYCDKDFKSEKRFYEFAAGRYLIKNIAKNFYNINDCEIITNEKGKPFFKNSNLHFSLSHSKNYVIVCFDKNECGIDIQFIRKLDLEMFSNYYNENFKNLDEFYRYWTLKEASYKQVAKVKDYKTLIFKDNYYLTVTSSKNIGKEIKISQFN